MSLLEIRAASAGTGKTTSLVQLYLEALKTIPARRIAAVTFTRASARDLRQRLRAGLLQLLETGRYLDVVMHTPEPFERALRELDSSVISTIHGFFRVLLRLNAPALALDPEFTNLDETEAKDLFKAAASSVLARAALTSGAGDKLLAEHGWEEALEALEMLFEKRVYAPFSGEDTALLEAFTAAETMYQARLAGMALSSTDVELRTLDLLQQPSVLSRVKQRFTLLLVDEFQDVNPLQAKVFTNLNLERIVFVGDAKQSIYAFRDADVSAFLQMYSQAKQLEPLTTTYRHGQQLAALYSSLAEALFPEFTEQGLPAAVQSGRVKAPSSAEMHFVEASNLELGRATEARILGQRLSALHRQGYAWRDMAVLLRTRGSLAQLEPSLRAMQIPFLVGSGQRYYDRREIRDAMLCLRAKMQPFAPDILAALARLPSINLSLESIEQLFAGDIRRALQNPDFAPLTALLEVIHSATDALGLLEAAWMHLGTNLTKEAQSYANLDGLLYQLAARGARDPRAALLFLERARLGEAEGDEPLEGEDAVRILTIHASKGLEFPVCAVFDLARGERNTGENIVIHPNGEIAWRGTGRYFSIQKHWNARRDGEANRLLYVALTRAKDVLILTGSSTGTARGWLATLEKIGWSNLPYLELNTYHEDESTPLGQNSESTAFIPLERNETLAKAVFKRHQPSVRAPTRSPEANEEHLPDELREGLPEADPSGIPEAERVIGTLAHYAIAENFSSQDVQHQRILAAQYVLHPYTETERAIMVQQALWYLTQYETLYPDRTSRFEDNAELPFAFVHQQTTWQGIIDRFYQQPDGTWILEDYKTDDIPLEQLPQRARAYYRQLAIYQEAIRQARNILPEVRLTFLHHGIVYQLETDELQAIITRL